MCIFAAAATVQVTKLFASMRDGRQTLVYEAKIESATANAMILPVPIDRSAASMSIELLDLSGFPCFFDDLSHHFISPPAFAMGGELDVFRVGSFEASIAMERGDLDRLSSRFVLADEIKKALADRYPDHAFVVYQFAPGKVLMHPFAFSFASRYRDRLFYPTVHVHDGAHVAATAKFSHVFFAQGARLDQRYGNAFSRAPSFPPFVDLARPLDHGHRHGEFANTDVFAPLA